MRKYVKNIKVSVINFFILKIDMYWDKHEISLRLRASNDEHYNGLAQLFENPRNVDVGVLVLTVNVCDVHTVAKNKIMIISIFF